MEGIKNAFTLGIELSKQYTQICYIDGRNGVVTLNQKQEYDKYAIPTCILKKTNEDIWVIGNDAINAKKNGQGTFIKNVIDLAIYDENTYIEGIKYSGTNLLEFYIREIIKIGVGGFNNPEITNVVITISKYKKTLMDSLAYIFKELGIKEDNFKIIGKTESFIYYTLNQSHEIWANKVILFDYDSDGLYIRQLSVSSGKAPGIVSVKEKRCDEMISIYELDREEKRVEADKIFINIINSVLEGNIISGVYLVGEGFNKKWMNESLNILCDKRRVFKGDNLYVKGTGYAAVEFFHKKHLENYIFSCKGRTKVNIYLSTIHDNREIQQIVSSAGVNWYESYKAIECILDNVDYLRFMVFYPITGQSKVLTMKLEDLPQRPNKTTRIKIELIYIDESHLQIQVTDRGFGEFYKATNKILKENITIEEAKEGDKDEWSIVM